MDIFKSHPRAFSRRREPTLGEFPPQNRRFSIPDAEHKHYGSNGHFDGVVTAAISTGISAGRTRRRIPNFPQRTENGCGSVQRREEFSIGNFTAEMAIAEIVRLLKG